METSLRAKRGLPRRRRDQTPLPHFVRTSTKLSAAVYAQVGVGLAVSFAPGRWTSWLSMESVEISPGLWSVRLVGVRLSLRSSGLSARAVCRVQLIAGDSSGSWSRVLVADGLGGYWIVRCPWRPCTASAGPTSSR